MSHRIMTPRHRQHGVAMIEVLVAVLITAFGILGFLGLQGQTAVSQLEGHQRTQALLLINDMAQRIALNRENAADYVADGIGIVVPNDCSALAAGATRDLCEWGQLIQGSAEVEDDTRVGAMLGAQACITSPATDEYLISLAWQGLRATGAPVNPCGKDDYSSEDTRRVVTTVLRVADLNS